MSVQRRSFTAKKAEPREEWLCVSASKIVGKADVLVSGTGTEHACSTFFVARLLPYCYCYSAVRKYCSSLIKSLTRTGRTLDLALPYLLN